MTQHSESTEQATRDPDELRSDLDQTRERVSADVEALGAKLSPANLKAEAKQAVTRRVHDGTERLREGVDAAETSIWAFCRENPIPLSLIGAGLGLLIYNSQKGNSQKGRRGTGRLVGQATQRLENGLEQGMQRARRVASESAERARTKFEELEETAREQARHAGQVARRSVDEQPLVIGAVALGAGLAVGLALPATDSENQLVGKYRERLVADARKRIGALSGVAEHAVDAAKGSVKRELEDGSAASAAE